MSDYLRLRILIGVRRAAAELIARLPFNLIRCALYRLIGYRIEKSKIGWGTVVAVESLEMSGARIGRRNKIAGPFRLRMAKGAAIGSDNVIWCDFWALDEQHRRFNYKRELTLEEHTLLTNLHYLDVVDRIRIGAGARVAGIASQFWTHGHSGEKRDIDIGVDCYIGSSCIFTPGAGIADRSIVGTGSVVSRRHSEAFAMIYGNPSEVRRLNYYWRTRSAVDPNTPPALPDNIASIALKADTRSAEPR